jgi:hypothetical protein
VTEETVSHSFNTCPQKDALLQFESEGAVYKFTLVVLSMSALP